MRRPPGVLSRFRQDDDLSTGVTINVELSVPTPASVDPQSRHVTLLFLPLPPFVPMSLPSVTLVRYSSTPSTSREGTLAAGDDTSRNEEEFTTAEVERASNPRNELLHLKQPPCTTSSLVRPLLREYNDSSWLKDAERIRKKVSEHLVPWKETWTCE